MSLPYEVIHFGAGGGGGFLEMGHLLEGGV